MTERTMPAGRGAAVCDAASRFRDVLPKKPGTLIAGRIIPGLSH